VESGDRKGEASGTGSTQARAFPRQEEGEARISNKGQEKSETQTQSESQEALMDPGALGVFVPITAMAVWGAVKIARIQAERHKSGSDPETADRLHALEHEVGLLRQEMSETQERLDFSERLLAQHRPDRPDPPK
jgi:protein-disulfide isomerase-like protein with CxxC motif